MPVKGEIKSYDLPLPTEPPILDKALGDISELYIRKDGDDGWFVGRVLLYANDFIDPLIGNWHVNQFLDSDDDVLRLRDWSTSSLCVAQATNTKFPLLPSGYRVLGPVIGPVSHNSAVILYRVDREGTYRFHAVDSTNGATVFDQTILLEPTNPFTLAGLESNRRYDFNLKFVRAGHEYEVPGAAGSVTTYTNDGERRNPFTFAFGSCANPNEGIMDGNSQIGKYTWIR